MSVHLVIVPEIGPAATRPAAIADRLRSKIRGALRAAGRELVGAVKAAAPRDTGRLANSTDSVVTEDSAELTAVVFSRVRYSLFVHGGATYGAKGPPRDALLAWARRHLAKGILRARASAGESTAGYRPRVKKSEAESLAFLVARAIKRRGLKPRPYLRTTLEQRAGRVGDLLRQAAAEALGGVR